jgi:hypothetical protein
MEEYMKVESDNTTLESNSRKSLPESSFVQLFSNIEVLDEGEESEFIFSCCKTGPARFA